MGLKRATEKKKGNETETNTETQDLVSGFCTVYSSGGCTFLRQHHMTGGMGV